MRKRNLKVLATIAIGVTTLAGCGVDLNPGAAAIVGNERISERDYRQTLQGMEQLSRDYEQRRVAGQVEGTFASAVLGSEITYLLSRDAATDLGIEITDTEIAQMLSQSEIETTTDQAAAFVRRTAYTAALFNKFQANPDVGNIAIQGMQEVAVKVNPRFGTWNADNLALVATNGSLSKPIDVPTLAN